MKKNNTLLNIKKKKNLLKNFIIAQNHLGFALKDTKFNSLNYLYNIRFDNTIIDLNQTILSLQRVFLMIKKIHKRKNISHKSILFIFEIPKIDIFYFSFFNGVLSYKNQKNYKGFLTNSKTSQKPELIILLNSQKNSSIINEAIISNIPIISLIDTNENPNLITFPIITNKQNVKSIFLILFLFMEFFNKNNLYKNNAITKSQK